MQLILNAQNWKLFHQQFIVHYLLFYEESKFILETETLY